ncbi:membrane protein-like protein 2 [Achromobacter insuavis AXX-A]|uniref:Membrane protein-like protein 2 n=1 Tax=Achromobacter insuavis AXX-A TaxID=1003200 RepID=F7T506_9BURK|nr:membrane protein-like protein 2 [Achromobacter insuavis AXX-A]
MRLAASLSLFALIVLCVTWETLVAPLRPGGSWMLLKALPLVLPLRGIVRGNLYTYQWASMLSLLYLMEGVVRAMSDPAPLSVLMAWGEILLSTVFFVSAIFYVRPAKRAARSQRA